MKCISMFSNVEIILNKWYVKVTYEREARIGILNFVKLYLINEYACMIYKTKNKGFINPEDLMHQINK